MCQYTYVLWPYGKGQLFSKYPFGVIVWTKIPTFLPQNLKRGEINKIKALSRHYQGPSSYDLTLFQILGQKFVKFFVGFLVQMTTPKGHFDINFLTIVAQCTVVLWLICLPRKLLLHESQFCCTVVRLYTGAME